MTSIKDPGKKAIGAKGTGWLEWLDEMGVDEAIGSEPVNRFELAPPASPAADPMPLSAAAPEVETPPRAAVVSDLTKSSDQLVGDAAALASQCNSIDDLIAALEGFDACPLKRTASNLCFADGKREAKVLLLGEAPGREEDLQGKPFVGRSGQLLDKMLAAIGLDRHADEPEKAVYISNTVYWRPPGNRKPTPAETEMCLPFVYRLIELMQPKIIMCVGATPSQRLLATQQGILRLRGKWAQFNIGERSIPLLPTLHPAYLLRQPAQKQLAWRDLLSLKHALETA